MYDIILYGATGYSGQVACQQLSKFETSELNWAIAGRNEQKLRELSQIYGCDYLLADAFDIASLSLLTKKSKVVLSCAGPYAIFGENLLRACVEQGCHYADISAEIPWQIEMEKKYGEQAELNKVKLIFASGFDSIPASVGVNEYLNRLALDGLSAESIGCYYEMRGGLNGGTLASGLNAKKNKLQMPSPSRSGVFPVPPDGKGYATDFVMSGLNEHCIKKSFSGRYHEHLKVSNIFLAYFLRFFFIFFDFLMSFSLGRRFVRCFGPKPGEGPSKKILSSGYVNSLFIEDDKKEPLKLEISWGGDPGNVVTTRCLITVGRLLLKNLNDKFGFQSPIEAFGDELLAELQRQGICEVKCDPDWEFIYSQGEYHYEPAPEEESVTLITAWNPNSVEHSEEWNVLANQKLESFLKSKNLSYGWSYGCNKPGDLPVWREDGYAVYGLDKTEAFELGSAWKQRAVVFYEKEDIQLLFCGGRISKALK